MNKVIGNRTQDCFNVIGIDTTSKSITIMRVGANYDRHLRRKNTMSRDYENGELLYVD